MADPAHPMCADDDKAALVEAVREGIAAAE
jgi:hypothetical protein